MSFKTLTSRSLGLGLVLFLAVAVAHGQAPADKATSKALSADTVLVVVNGMPITQADCDAWVQRMYQMQMSRIPPQQAGQIRPEQLEQLRQVLAGEARQGVMKDKLLEAAAKDYLKKVTDKDIEDQIDQTRRLAARQGVDFDEYMKKNNISMEKIKNDLREPLAKIKFIESSEGSAEPSDKDVKAFIEENKDRLTQPESVRTSHILLGYGDKSNDPTFKPSADERAKAKAEAEKVLKEVKAGGDFAKLAEKYSTDQFSKVEGGKINAAITHQSGFVQEYKDAAFKLKKKGDISPITESKFGFHIIKLDDRKTTVTATMETVGKDMRWYMRQQKLSQMGEAASEKLLAKAKIDVKVPEQKKADPLEMLRAPKSSDMGTTVSKPARRTGNRRAVPAKARSAK
ncbi:peptidylprolyl isomerase [bacterium]|nr:peptidylprolyl isomerase [bacterium]